MGTCVDISIYISRLRNAEGGHVIGRSLYVVMLNKRCIIFLHAQSIFFNKYVYSIKVNSYYQSMQDLVNAVNKALARNVNDNIKLTYNTLNGKVTVQLKNGYQLGLIGRMSIILGFGDTDLKIIKKSTVSPYVTDLTVVSTIYVYFDIVELQVVGDTSAQLLKSILAEGKFGDVIAKTFTNIQYVPVQTKSFGNVEVLLRNDTGDPVPFERGKVIITLHFKQKSSPYFL